MTASTTATGVLTSSDVEGAKRLVAQKNAFRSLENKTIDEHLRNSGKGRGGSLKSALFVDMIRDLHRSIRISFRPVPDHRGSGPVAGFAHQAGKEAEIAC